MMAIIVKVTMISAAVVTATSTSPIDAVGGGVADGVGVGDGVVVGVGVAVGIGVGVEGANVAEMVFAA